MITKEEAEKAYQELVQLRRSEVLVKSNENPGKIEIHHIIPISCNGEDVDENKIALYAKEHFMAHVYLWIIHHDDEFHNQTLCALNLMIKGTLNGNRQELRDFILASEEYQKAREEFAKLMSQTIGLKVSGQKNGHFGFIWVNDPILEESFLWPKDLELNYPYKYGRIIDFTKTRDILANKQMNKIFKNEHNNRLKEL